jgi:hypothetical protein
MYMFRRKSSARRSSRRFNGLWLEALEDRLVPSTVKWTGNANDGLWSSAGNWSTNSLPQAADDVVIDVNGAVVNYAIAGATTTVKSITNSATLDVKAGSLTTTGAVSITGTLDMDGGTLTGQGGVTVTAATVNFNSGTISIPSNGAVTLTNTSGLFFAGNATGTGNFSFVAGSSGSSQLLGTIPAQVTVTVGSGVNILVPSFQQTTENLTVNGTLIVNNAASYAAKQGGNSGVESIVVNGTMNVTNTNFSQATGPNNNVSYIQVSPGGHLTASGATFGWQQLILANGSVLSSGDITGNGFDCTLYVPAAYVPLLTANKRFQDVNINTDLPGGQNVTLQLMGTDTTANLRYVFPASFTVNAGAALTFGPNCNVLQRGYQNAAENFTVNGSLTVSSGVSFVVDQNGNNGLEQIVVNGTMTATNVSFVPTGNNGNTATIVVNPSGHLAASGCTFAWVGWVSWANGSVLNSGDISSNGFDCTVYAPAAYVPQLTANKRFRDVDINADLPSGQNVTLGLMGTDTTANLRYVFPASFTINAGAALTLGTNCNVFQRGYQNTGETFTVNGTFTVSDGVTFLVEQGGNGGVETLLVNGTMVATNANFVGTGNNGNTSQIAINPNGHLLASGCTFAWGQVIWNNGSVLNQGDITGNGFDCTVYTPAAYVPQLTANKRFQDVYINADLASGQNVTFGLMGTDTTANLRYVFPGQFTINAGATLTIGPGCNLLQRGYQSYASYFNVNGTLNVLSSVSFLVQAGAAFSWQQILVNGTMNATNASFVRNNQNGGTSSVQVDAGGHLAASGCTFSWDYFTLEAGSGNVLTFSMFPTKFTIDSAANLSIFNNDLTTVGANGIVATGASTSQINLSNNYWGPAATQDPTQIPPKILDHNDDGNRPTVDYNPILPAEAAYKLSMTCPASATAGSAIQVTVSLLDFYGNITSINYPGAIHLSASDAAALLPADYQFTAADHGTHVFQLTLETAGTQTVSVSDTSAQLAGVSAGVTVSPNSLSKLLVSAPSTTTANTPFNLRVTAQDAYNNTITNFGDTVTFTISDPAAPALANYQFLPADQGTHLFAATLENDGLQTITANDVATMSVTGSASIYNTGPFTLTAPASATAGSAFTVTLTAHNGLGQQATSYRGTVHWTTSAASAGLPAGYAFTAADQGVHTFTIKLNTAGSQVLTASDTLNASSFGSATITVNAAAVTHFGFRTPASSNAGTPFAFVTQAQDAFNNVVPSYVGTVHFSSNDPAAAVPADYTFQAGDQGSAVLAATLFTAGKQNLTATDTGTSTLTGTASVQVLPGAITHFRVSTPTTTVAGTKLSVSVKALDQFGNAASSYRGTVHFTSSDPVAVLPGDYVFTATDAASGHTFNITLKTAGSQSITVTDLASSLLQGSASLAVTAKAATHFRLTAPAGAIAGAPFAVSLVALDPFNNVDLGYTGTVHFTSTDARAILPADYAFQASDQGLGLFAISLRTAGSQTLKAADTVTAAITGTRSLPVSPAALDHFLLSVPNNRVAGQTFTMTVTAQDAFANTITSYTGTVHFTSTDPAATLPGDYTFTSTDKGAHQFVNVGPLVTAGKQTVTVADTVQATIQGAAPVSVKAAAATHFAVTAAATVKAGAGFPVAVKALDPYGNIDTTYAGTVHFTSSDGAAILPAAYTFTAGTGTHVFTGVVLKTLGTQTITVTDTVTSSITGTASITVTTTGPAPAVAPGGGVAPGDDWSRYVALAHEGHSTPTAGAPAPEPHAAAMARSLRRQPAQWKHRELDDLFGS